MKKVVVGLSGGVDSSVAALLLKEQGYEVIGLFMKNWHDDSVTISKECPWLDDSNDALIVAEKLGIPFQTVDLSGPYKERIVEYMFREYQQGRTPNPDVLCNREIKFKTFLEHAVDLGAQKIATGHYVRSDRRAARRRRLHCGRRTRSRARGRRAAQRRGQGDRCVAARRAAAGGGLQIVQTHVSSP